MDNLVMMCPLCDIILDKMVDEYYFICNHCGAYVKDKKYYKTPEQEKRIYEEHNNDVEDVRYQNFTAPITKAIFKNHTTAHLGLDYGCGTGPVISKQLMDKGYQVKLFDPYFYPDHDYIDQQYDFIFSCEVFEHFYQPKHEIDKLVRLLKPEGKLYIMTHLYHSEIDFKNWYYRNDPTHVFIYTVKTIEFIADTYNLSIEKLTTRLIIIKKLPS